MKTVHTYRISIQALLLVVLAGVLLNNMNSSLTWTWETATESSELCDPIDNKSEKEDNKAEQDSDDKIPTNLYRTKILAGYRPDSSLLLKHLFSFHHLEIQTPPPESASCLS